MSELEHNHPPVAGSVRYAHCPACMALPRQPLARVVSEERLEHLEAMLDAYEAMLELERRRADRMLDAVRASARLLRRREVRP